MKSCTEYKHLFVWRPHPWTSSTWIARLNSDIFETDFFYTKWSRKFEMAENILLFSNSRAFISSLFACIKINISILTTTLTQVGSISLLIGLSPTGCGIVWFETWNQRPVKWLSFSLALYKNILGSSRAYKSPGETTTNSQTGKSGYRRRVEIKLLVSKCKRSNVGMQSGNY